MSFGSLEALTGDHILEGFSCGEESLDVWLTETAQKSEKLGDARTYVVSTDRVVGYYCLSTGSVRRDESGGRIARNAPEPVPVIVLGRLAVDTDHQGAGLGHILAADAIERCVAASEAIGARAIVVNPINDTARAFWIAVGFDELPKDPSMLYLRIVDARNAIESGR